MSQHTHILMFSLGPVQGFIAEARRTADLRNGSHMLVAVARAAATVVDEADGTLIFPTANTLKTADVPNVFVALVANPRQIAQQAIEAAQKQWRTFADAAWENLHHQDDPLLKEMWQRQRDNHLEFYWVAVPYSNDKYKASYKRASQALAARKRTRNFNQPSHEDGPKDSLSGSRSALRTGQIQHKAQSARDFWQQMRRNKTAAELQKEELLDTIGAMKRFSQDDQDDQKFPSASTVAATSFIIKAAAHNKALLDVVVEKIETINQTLKNLPPDIDYNDEDVVHTVRRVFDKKEDYLRSIRNAADPAFLYGGDLLFTEGWARGRLEENYGKLPDVWFKQINDFINAAVQTLKKLYEKSEIKLSPYYAILQMDGDWMGKHVGQCEQLEEHQKLSERLADFTEKVKEIVTANNGHLIYAGGDDVLAFFPADTVLEAVNEMASTYRDLFPSAEWNHQDDDRPFPFTASAGIAFAHYVQPLDLVLEAARAAEKRAKAKDKYGRNAVCVTVLRRSGERLDVGGKWAGEAERENAPAPNTVEMLTELVEHLEKKQISSRFPYNVLRDAPIITAIEKTQARELILRQLVKQHKSKTLNKETVNNLIQKWLEWANRHNQWTPPDPDSPPGNPLKNQGFTELARWFILARWLAEGGQE